MKVRIKFSKHGSMKFVGHLDLLRYFQKAIRRAGIDIAFSDGFSPHMVQSFAAPLGVGLTSDGEYMDIEVINCPSSKDAVERLNGAMSEGIEVKSFRRIPDEKASNAMSIVAAADYTVALRENIHLPEGWEQKLNEFYKQETITILKKTKKSEKEVDIKPFLHELSIENQLLFMRLSAGSTDNLKPELVMDAFFQYLKLTLPPFALMVNRVEIYAGTASGEGEKLISLEDLGEEIVE